MDDKWVAAGIVAIIILSIINAKNPIKNSGGLFNVPQNNFQERPAENTITDGILDKDKTISKYSQYITINNGYGYSADNEYIEIVNNSNTEKINITGFTLKSTSTGVSITIPKSVKLYFTGMENVEENVILEPRERAYIITGRSPIGYGMKINKCSGYLTQYNNFSPSFYTNCPSPREENLSSIPKTVNNDICFDLIEYYPSCRVQEDPLSNKYSSECQSFIYNKINYPNCINTYKNDNDFWDKKWYVYLKRSDKLWKDRRENIILYDTNGKIISKITRN